MTIKKTQPDKTKLDQIVTDARRNQELREQSYRGQALKLYPWVCGRCAREFDHKNLTELTVHHKNHNHDDNPSDGSNWELLCLYAMIMSIQDMKKPALTAQKQANPVRLSPPIIPLQT